MRMGVDQTRYHRTSIAIQHLVRSIRGRNLISRTNSLNEPLTDSHCSRSEQLKIIVHRGDSAASQDGVDLDHSPLPSIAHNVVN
jgi:hypothetical protein